MLAGLQGFLSFNVCMSTFILKALRLNLGIETAKPDWELSLVCAGTVH
jgi:hypothetical protein